MVENNAAVYDVSDKITFVNGDFFEVAPTIHADTVVLDPPWGGPSYKELGVFRLVNFEAKSQTAKAVDGAAMLRLSLEHFNEVLLRVPTNFDISELDAYNVPYEVHDDRMDDRIICRSVVFRKNS